MKAVGFQSSRVGLLRERVEPKGFRPDYFAGRDDWPACRPGTGSEGSSERGRSHATILQIDIQG